MAYFSLIRERHVCHEGNDQLSCLSYETQVLYSWEAKPNPTAEQNLKKESHSKRHYYVCSYPVDRWQERMAILL